MESNEPPITDGGEMAGSAKDHSEGLDNPSDFEDQNRLDHPQARRTAGRGVLRVVEAGDLVAPIGELEPETVILPDLSVDSGEGLEAPEYFARVLVIFKERRSASWHPAVRQTINRRLEGRSRVTLLLRDRIQVHFGVSIDSPSARDMVQRFGEGVVATIGLRPDQVTLRTSISPSPSPDTGRHLRSLSPNGQ